MNLINNIKRGEGMELPGMLTILLCRLRADHQNPIGIGFQLRELIRLGVPLAIA